MFSLIQLLGGAQTASEGAQTASTGSSSSIILLVAMVAIFYFLLIRPQKKRDKEAKEMMASLKKGDKIVTIGGIRGTVSSVKETTVVVKVDADVKIEFNKTAIAQVLNETPKTEEPAKKFFSKKEKKEEVVEKPVEVKAEEAPAEEPVVEAAPETAPETENKEN